MARNSATTGLESRAGESVFSSPVALAFVGTVVARRGVSDAQARKIYLDYLTRAQREQRPSKAA
ncbi:hypothetical protein CQ12_18600 [Bradyrhizobium jicamae]|uniref:Uncharacterized protein n=1 Tax=Bradyrhizobium jicamae TaxID=280332 RepID=A0A0R3LBG8_9BRAD|nr:hypothetical protein [Bradyrhizobium jicamae]KRR02230.1 hypothetical protein CQ12_18600 [Bradyrhizobium jicamae]